MWIHNISFLAPPAATIARMGPTRGSLGARLPWKASCLSDPARLVDPEPDLQLAHTPLSPWPNPLLGHRGSPLVPPKL